MEEYLVIADVFSKKTTFLTAASPMQKNQNCAAKSAFRMADIAHMCDSFGVFSGLRENEKKGIYTR